MPIPYDIVSEEAALQAQFSHLPKGDHAFTIKGYVEVGKDKYQYKTEIKNYDSNYDGPQVPNLIAALEYNGKFGKKIIIDYIPLKGQAEETKRQRAKFRQLAKAAGLEAEYDNRTIEVHQLINKHVVATVGHKDAKSQSGKEYIKEVIYAYHAPTGSALDPQSPTLAPVQDGPPAGHPANMDDEIPF